MVATAASVSIAANRQKKGQIEDASSKSPARRRTASDVMPESATRRLSSCTAPRSSHPLDDPAVPAGPVVLKYMYRYYAYR